MTSISGMTGFGRADGAAVPAVVAGRGGAALLDARHGLAYPALDLAVAEAARADRWDEATWRRLEAQAGVETRLPVAVATDPAPPDPAQPKAGTLTTPRRKRRAYTPNFMRD